ncbi:uncharacterized protein [Magallana gigas]|uniref:uncharacterized protein n=1 Tax=Magallana gigas TaxID=29159 RepID=UPI00333FDB86
MNPMITILLLICFLTEFIAFTNSDICRSQDGNLDCCPGFVWNIKENKCKQCDAGTIGPHCEIVCPYPWYGKQCLSKCNCSKDHCDPADGCIEWTTQVLLPKHTSTVSRSEGLNDIGMGMLTIVPFETDNADASTDSQISYKWVFVTTVPLCVIFGIIIVALMFKHLRQRRDIVTIDAAYTVPTNQNVRHIYDLCDEGHHQENPKRENGQDQENTKDAAYTAPTHQNVRHIYDLCNESLHPENAITEDDGYLTVVDKKDSE